MADHTGWRRCIGKAAISHRRTIEGRSIERSFNLGQIWPLIFPCNFTGKGYAEDAPKSKGRLTSKGEL